MAKIRERTGSARRSWKTELKRDWVVYLLFVPIIVYEIVLHYLPMFGIVMAFEDYSITSGYFGSPWVGFKHFEELFTSEDFPQAIRNTLIIGSLRATVGFVAPIIFALMLSLINSKRFKRIAQTMSYLPNFVAAVIVCSLFTQFLAKDGPLTLLLTKLFGAPNQNWLAVDTPPAFWIIYTFMGIWQSIGWGSIMYVAAISQVSGDLHEAAALDGASRLQRLFKITLPSILPMIMMMFVINIGTALGSGYDNILLLYMPSTYSVSDTVYTYTYRQAFGGGNSNYSLSAASGLFQSVICTALLVGSNALSRKVSNSSLF
ncbi:MAG: ABC transporter permease [Aristaeellaceae bacterium]